MSERRGEHGPTGSEDAARIRAFLARAEAAGLIDGPTARRLSRALLDPSMLRTVPARPDATTGIARPDVPTAVTRPPTPRPTGRPLEVAPPIATAPAPQPRRERVRELIASDLALHGLAYLGVLMMFVGAFGFVVFAFGEVDPFFRPLAEAAIPLVCFVGAWFLHRQRAPHVAVALEMLGGLTLPVVAFASFADDAGIPPDLWGNAIAIALALTASAIGAGYAWWARRHPESPLRYLVTPMAWMAVWGLGVGLGPDVVEGTEIREPNPAQMAWFTVAVTATVAVARAFPRRWLARETLAVAPIGIALGLVLGFASTPASGWPAWSILVTGTAALVGIDLIAVGPARRAAVRMLEVAVIGATALMLIEPLGEAWPGTVAVLGGVALAERWRRDGIDEISVALLTGLGGVGLAASLTAGWPAVVGFGTAGAWALWRRPEAPADVARIVDVVAASLPAGLLVGLLNAMDDDDAMLVAAGILLAAAGASRLRHSSFDGAWTAGASMVVGAGVLALRITEGDTTPLALAATVLAAAAAVRPGPVATRPWAAWPLALLAAGLWLDLGDVGIETTLVLAAVAGVVLVVLAPFVPAGPRAGPGVTLEALGHLTTGSALAVALGLQDGPTVACLAVWTVGWAWSAAAEEAQRDPLVAVFARPPTDEHDAVVWPAWAPAWIVAISAPFLLVDASATAGWWTAASSHGIALAGLAVAEAAGTWALRGRTIPAQVCADASIVTLLPAWAAVASSDSPVVVVGLATVVAVVITAPGVRRRVAAWYAWLATAPVVLRAAELWGGVPEEELYAPLFVWGVVLAVGALAVDDARAGRREPGAWVRLPAMEAPATLGVLGSGGALTWVATTQPADVWAPWFAAGAVVAAVLAWQARAGAVSAVAWGLAIAAGSQLARALVLDSPWVAVAAAAVPVTVAIVAWPRRSRPAWARWDLPALVAAHVVVAWALVESFPADRVAATWLSAAALSFALSVGLRLPVWAIAGGILAIVGAEALGPWWLALTLALEAAATWLAAARAADRARIVLQGAGTMLSAASWAATVAATGWSDPTELRATAIVAGTVALVAGVATRARTLSPDWLIPAGTLALVGWSRAGSVLHLQEMTTQDHLVLAASAAAIALAAGIAAAPARTPALRDAAAVIALGAGAEVVLAIDPSPATATAMLVAASMLSLLAALALWRANHLAWVRPLVVAGAVAGVTAPPVAAAAWPSRAPMVAALIALGAESAAAGMLLRRPVVFGASPIFLCAAWLVFATAIFTGEPMWFTVPVGIAALVVIETVRWDHRLRHEAVKTPELVAFELLAIAIVVGAAPFQIVTGHLWAGLTGAALGVAIAIWGIETHVRRRVWAGVVATAGCLLMLALVPLVKQLPNVEQATLWVLLGGLGALVVIVATAIERGRPKLRTAMHHLHELMDGWE